jgi:hypothetical protein
MNAAGAYYFRSLVCACTQRDRDIGACLAQYYGDMKGVPYDMKGVPYDSLGTYVSVGH